MSGYFSGGSGASIGGAVTGGTAGSVLFVGAGGVLAQDNPGITYDNTTNKEVFTLTSGGNSDTATVYSTDILYNGDRGLRIRSTRADAYYPVSLRLENAAYNTYTTILQASSNGLYMQTQGNALYRFDSSIGGPTSLFQIEIANSANATAVTSVSTQFATQVGQRTVLAAAQAADAQQVFANDGTTKLFAVNQAGSPMTKANAAPADGTINSNECYMWFDSTAGTAAINFKGKNSSGTVVTATLPLT